MKRLIINADDFGMTDGVCRAIVELLDMGALTDTTVMMVLDGGPERAVAYGGRGMEGTLGLHLQLTSGRALSPAAEIPSLVDAEGIFSKRHDKGVVLNPEEVALEWGRQVEAFVDLFGFVPTHLDNHQNVVDLQGLEDVYLALAARLNVPVRRGRVAATAPERAKFGVRGTDEVLAQWSGKNLGLVELKEELSRVDTLAELVCHPAYCDDELMAITSWNTLRETELNALKQLHEERWLEGQGIALVNYAKAFGG